MNKTELLNKFSKDPEERMALARVLDQMERTEQRSIPCATQFLTPAQRAAAEPLLNACGHPKHFFFGGYEGAERTVCVFLPDWLEPEDFVSGDDLPLGAVEATFPAGASLTHRDILGGLMGTGLTREKIGDILVVHDTVATLRLDAVLSSGFSIARGKAADLISGGRVSVNHRECTKADKAVAEGDVLTCRGLGKCILKTVGGASRKGRVMIEIERYV